MLLGIPLLVLSGLSYSQGQFGIKVVTNNLESVYIINLMALDHFKKT